MHYNRFLPLIIPLLSWLLLESFFFKPNLVYVVFVLIVLINFFAARQLIVAGGKEEKWWNLVILPINFTAGLIIFSVLLTNQLLVQALFAVNIIFLYLYWRTIYYYLVKISSYDQRHLENIAAYGNFLAFFFIAAGLYGLQSFLNASTGILMLVLLIAAGLAVYQSFWANRINFRIGFLYILIISLVLVELAWAASFLTLSYYILGLLVAIFYYVIIGLARFYLTGVLNRKIIQYYLAYSLFSLIIVLLTARWL